MISSNINQNESVKCKLILCENTNSNDNQSMKQWIRILIQ